MDEREVGRRESEKMFTGDCCVEKRELQSVSLEARKIQVNEINRLRSLDSVGNSK